MNIKLAHVIVGVSLLVMFFSLGGAGSAYAAFALFLLIQTAARSDGLPPAGAAVQMPRTHQLGCRCVMGKSTHQGWRRVRLVADDHRAPSAMRYQTALPETLNGQDETLKSKSYADQAREEPEIQNQPMRLITYRHAEMLIAANSTIEEEREARKVLVAANDEFVENHLRAVA